MSDIEKNTSKYDDLLPPKNSTNTIQSKDIKGKKDTKKLNNFANVPKNTIPSTGDQASYGDIIDLLSVSPTAGDNPTTVTDKLQDFFIMFIKYSFLVVILTLNFLGLSASLNCNADQDMAKRIFSAIFAFFFGFVYLLINYYTYKVMYQGKICKFNKDKLFPFKA